MSLLVIIYMKYKNVYGFQTIKPKNLKIVLISQNSGPVLTSETYDFGF